MDIKGLPVPQDHELMQSTYALRAMGGLYGQQLADALQRATQEARSEPPPESTNADTGQGQQAAQQ